MWYLSRIIFAREHNILRKAIKTNVKKQKRTFYVDMANVGPDIGPCGTGRSSCGALQRIAGSGRRNSGGTVPCLAYGRGCREPQKRVRKRSVRNAALVGAYAFHMKYDFHHEKRLQTGQKSFILLMNWIGNVSSRNLGKPLLLMEE